jgi:hypothetical protein
MAKNEQKSEADIVELIKSEQAVVLRWLGIKEDEGARKRGKVAGANDKD